MGACRADGAPRQILGHALRARLLACGVRDQGTAGDVPVVSSTARYRDGWADDVGIVSRPATPHRCTPGWVKIRGDIGPRPTMMPPRSSDYPRGTVWECDDEGCDRRWVSKGLPGVGSFSGGGITARTVKWRPERWWTRRKRLRARAADTELDREFQSWATDLAAHPVVDDDLELPLDRYDD